MKTQTERVDVLAALDLYGVDPEVRATVFELIAAAEEARFALYACIDALGWDADPSDLRALNRITNAIANTGFVS